VIETMKGSRGGGIFWECEGKAGERGSVLEEANRGNRQWTPRRDTFERQILYLEAVCGK